MWNNVKIAVTEQTFSKVRSPTRDQLTNLIKDSEAEFQKDIPNKNERIAVQAGPTS